MLTGTVHTVVCTLAAGQSPRVTVKYDITDPANPALGSLPAERELVDAGTLAQIAALATALIPATSAVLGIPLTTP